MRERGSRHNEKLPGRENLYHYIGNDPVVYKIRPEHDAKGKATTVHRNITDSRYE